MEFALERMYGQFLLASGVSIDTRTLPRGAMFFALKGAQQDGHRYVDEARSKGARYVVVSEKRYSNASDCIYVEDTLKALQALALFHRRRYKRHVIGITGSQGKTTLRALLHAVLSQRYVTQSSPHSYNNHIGVPLSLLGLFPQTEVAILELGASAAGEIKDLCALAKPTHGYITRVGQAHLGGFQTKKGVFRAKKELFDYLDQTGGIFFHHTREESLSGLVEEVHRAKVVAFPTNKTEKEALSLRDAIPYLTCAFGQDKESIKTHLVGRHHYDLVLAAWHIGRYFEVPPEQIKYALQTFEPLPHRLQWHKTKRDNTLLDDCYNASPEAMNAALDIWDDLGDERAQAKAVILGDMCELGTESARLHQSLGKRLAKSPFETILLCGKEMEAATKACPKAKHFQNTDELTRYLKKYPFKNAHILLKASRSLQFEQLLSCL